MKTDNELIAEFLGVKKRSKGWDFSDFDIYTFDSSGEPTSMIYEPYSMLFDSSWDWLMPVVKKISDLHYVSVDKVNKPLLNRQLDIEASKVLYIRINIPIEVVYRLVVEFIKWYNQNKV